MSLRSFTVFQDTVSSGPSHPKITRPGAMSTRSAGLNLGANPNATTLAGGDQVAIDKENVHPVTGERSGPITGAGKKRKTSVLAAKVQPPVVKHEKEKDRDEPEKKKRKASASSSGTSGKGNKSSAKLKASGSGRKSSSKRASSRKVSPMPQLQEEDENKGSNERKEQDRPTTQVGIDSRCYELTVKPLADVSQAYEDVSPFGPLPTASATTTSTTTTAATGCIVDDHSDVPKVKFGPRKASSVEPEVRDYFEDPADLFSRLPSFSHSNSSLSSVADFAGVPEGRTFSTPERKQIYAAFTFSSPSGSGSGSGSSLVECLDYSDLNGQDKGQASRSGGPSPSLSPSNGKNL